MTDRDYTTKRDTYEVGTLRELNVQPGDVVECVGAQMALGNLTVCKQYTIGKSGCPIDDKGDEFAWSFARFRIISRAAAALPHSHARLPSGAVVDLTAITTPFGLLDAETQEALRKSGGPYEMWNGFVWKDTSACHDGPSVAHRVKPQPPAPVVETVTVSGRAVGRNGGWVFGDPDGTDTHRITFDLINGKPDPASIRMVAL